ncbi:anti-sigma factor domain-containing protein [Sphingobium sp. B12D2B]|nr:anti-sigma factor [Sphingobium sp. B12D2B]MCW2349127.1 anti-sigma-K factor RskA [Sphingobium sp. B12D2B]
MLAAELALGILDGDERAIALRLQVSDPAFRSDVLAWQARFEPLLDDYEDTEAPNLWHAIEKRLQTGGAARSSQPEAIRRKLAAWRFGTFSMGAIAACLAIFPLVRPAPPPVRTQTQVARVGQPAIAQLGTGEDAHQFAVNYDTSSGELSIRTLKMPSSPLSPELWIIPTDNVPRSLGLVSATGSKRIIVAPQLRPLLKDGATLAITLEKSEGVPHKAPSSAPVATGSINII